MPDVTIVGIVANPASARDIRRLVADGALVTTNDKVNMLRRVLAGLQSAGVERALSMIDLDGISAALVGLAGAREAAAWPALDFVDQPLTRSAADTTFAVRAMVAAGAKAIVVLGGDGTNGVVADACGDVPIASISTGTNNAFPRSAEPTVVGIAAGLVATGTVAANEATWRAKSLTVRSGGRRHRALVDVAVTTHDSIATGAVWDPATLREVFSCFAEPDRIGLSSIGARLCPVRRDDPFGLHVRIGRPAVATVRAPLGPGLIPEVDVTHVACLSFDSPVEVATPDGVVAVDGERVFRFGAGDSVTLTLSADGPHVVDVERTLEIAARRSRIHHQRHPAGGHP